MALGLVTAVAILGDVLLSAAQASADDCALTAQDQQYLQLLARHDLGPRPGDSACDAAEEGRQIVADLRNSDDPRDTAADLVRIIHSRSPLSEQQAAWEVEVAIKVYAPDLIPMIWAPPQP